MAAAGGQDDVRQTIEVGGGLPQRRLADRLDPIAIRHRRRNRAGDRVPPPRGVPGDLVEAEQGRADGHRELTELRAAPSVAGFHGDERRAGAEREQTRVETRCDEPVDRGDQPDRFIGGPA